MSFKLKIGAIAVVAILVLAVLTVTRMRKKTASFQAAFNAEFLTRADGYKGLLAHYRFKFPAPVKQMDSGLMYKALANGAVDVIDGFSTDGRIPAYQLLVLEDDKHFFPPYDAAPLIRQDTLNKHPEIRIVLNRLSGRISNAKMQKMNYAVDEKGEKAISVAKAFLDKEGLLNKAAQTAKAAGTVIVGAKEFTEQEILGEIMCLMLEHHTTLNVVKKLNLGGTMICFNALSAGDLDLYADYTGTGLVNILKMKAVKHPEQAYATVKAAFAKKYAMVWLNPFGFNNTYTLTMRRGHARKLGIATISDLAAYLNRITPQSE